MVHRRLFMGMVVSACAASASTPPTREPMAGPSDSGDTAIPYVFHHREYAARLAASSQPSDRRRILNERWEQLKLAVAHCNVAEDINFYNSLTLWKSGWQRTGKWTRKEQDDLKTPLRKVNPSVWVQGNCLAEITSKGGHNGQVMIHILGDLKSTLSVEGHCEIVIGGDIAPGAGIISNGITRVFVGGDMNGLIRDGGSGVVWIHGDFSGKIESGVPTLDLSVMGDFKGELRPMGELALLRIDVRGFMPNDEIVKIARLGYTDFRATIGHSDVPPGLYPTKGMLATIQQPTNTWVVHRQRSATEAAAPKETKETPEATKKSGRSG